MVFDEETYDFVEISNKIIHWKPSSLSIVVKELTKLTKQRYNITIKY